MIKIEYRYKYQKICRSFTKQKNIEEAIDWLKRFKNGKLESHTKVENIEEIRINLIDQPYVYWIQMYKKIWGQWEIALIINDFPIGQLFSFDETIRYLEIGCKELIEKGK